MNGRTTLISAVALVTLVSACRQGSYPVSEADISLVNSKPLASNANRLTGKERAIKPNEHDFVPEQVAQSLLRQLEQWPGNAKQLADSLYHCSGILASTLLGNKSQCVNDYSAEPDEACLKKHRYGSRSVGQALTTDRFDLNGDGVSDYIISDRYYCHELSANQSNVYFVMLSAPEGNFRLAFADWASYDLSVVEEKDSGKKILIEQAPKTYGTYTRILHLDNGRYVARICIFQDEKGYRRCESQ